MGCSHENKEVEGQYTITDKHGAKRTVRSYRCPDCGEVWSDGLNHGEKAPTSAATKVPKSTDTAPDSAQGKETEDMAKKQVKKAAPKKAAKKAEAKDKPNVRMQKALADKRFAPGKVHTKEVTSRKTGKTHELIMTCKADGFYDNYGNRFDTPSACVTNFAVKIMKQAPETRRPPAAFFGLPILEHKNTRPDCKEKKAKKVAKPKAATKKAAKPKAEKKAAPKKAAKPKAEKKAAKPKAVKKPEPKAEETKPANGNGSDPNPLPKTEGGVEDLLLD